MTNFFQSQLVQGSSHSRLNVSPLREVSAKVEADAASSIKDRQIILSPAELMKPTRTNSRSSTTRNSPSNSKQNSPAPPELGIESAVNRVINIFRGRSASSASAEDKKRLLQKVKYCIQKIREWLFVTPALQKTREVLFFRALFLFLCVH